MAVNGKAKGSKFEREIAKYLTKWLGSTNKKDIWIWRTPQSGGLATILGSKEVSGDLIATHDNAKPFLNLFSLELKNGYPSASIDNFFKNNKKDEYKSFWMQCIRDAEKSNKNPMLIFKKKGNYPIIVCINDKIYEKLNSKLYNMKSIIIQWELENMIIFDFNEFFENITPKELCKLCQV